MICEYGCGQEAQYQFKNGKWCCSKNVSKCPNVLKTIKVKSIGRTHSQETKEKISSSKIGKKQTLETIQKRIEKCKNKKRTIEQKKNISEGRKGIKHSEETLKKMSESHKGQIPWNKGKLGVYTNETLKQMSISSRMTEKNKRKIKIKNRRTIEFIKNKYSLFSKIEEMRYNPGKPGEKEIQVRCKNHNCSNSKEKDGWFSPTYYQFSSRIWAIENDDGNNAHYFYCSEECKQQCPLFNKTINQLIKENQKDIKQSYYTYSEYNEYRNEVLKRSNYLCEYCGNEATHVHHSRPQKLEPFFSLDPDFGISCCEKCHYEKGHVDECSTGQLATIICKT